MFLFFIKYWLSSYYWLSINNVFEWQTRNTILLWTILQAKLLALSLTTTRILTRLVDFFDVRLLSMFFIFDFFIIKLICEEWLKLFFYFGVCNFCFLFCIFLKPLLSLFICFFLWEVFVSDFFLDGPNIFRMPHIFLSLSLSAIKVVLYSFIDIT